jgi:sulfatase maturation enzyme AslB (radical SAM superfamily)
MTGGEPTLIKNNFRFMEECIRQGRTDILLFFNTNCTNLNRRFFELISEFKQVNINASVDGTGAVNEYIRSPSNWEQVDANIRRLSSIPTVYLGLTPTVQVYNIYNIPAILDYVRNLQTEYNRSDIFVDLLINVHPYMLNVGILSDTMRQQARKDIDSWLAQWGNTVPELTINSVRGIQGLLQAERRTDWQEQIQDLKTYTLSLDAERSQTYQVLDQRLHELFT